MSARHHPEHHGLKRYEMIERDFARASRDTGDVPTRVTAVIAAYYYEDLLDKLTAAQQRIAALESENVALRDRLNHSERLQGRFPRDDTQPKDST